MLTEGSPAPDLTLADHEGNDVSLSDFRGRRLVLWFYPKADTPGCTAEGCAFRDLSSEFAQRNASILGVSFDTPAENKAFHEKFHFTFPLLSDTGRELAKAFGAADDASAAMPRRAAAIIGADGRVEKVWPKVDARTFPSTALATLDGKG